jgi:5-methylcytosine-specific restriction enzyme A
MAREITAKSLMRDWNVDVEHGLYNWCGKWYHRLERFPAALFDENGYVRFESEKAYVNCPQLRLSKDCGCPDGISQIDGYEAMRMRTAIDIAEPNKSRRIETSVSRIIRDTRIVRSIKEIYADQCQLCGMVIQLLDATYSEAHHIRPLGAPHNGADEMTNLLVVCPTCHVKLDFAAIEISIQELAHLKHDIDGECVEYHNVLHRARANKTLDIKT